jgi:exportin-2 (importin alpha re-exporter)
MMGIVIRRESSLGVSEVNQGVNLMEFFKSNILAELGDVNHTVRPVVKAAAIKFVCTFRNQFTTDDLVLLLPVLISHLNSPVVVVHTFSAYAIERILTAKQDLPDRKSPRKMGSNNLKPFLEPLFNGLFAIIDNEANNENEYAMKCIMRSLVSAGQEVVPVTEIVIAKLTSILGRIAKNPRNPQFNHYLFESIAVLIGSVALPTLMRLHHLNLSSSNHLMRFCRWILLSSHRMFFRS